MIDKVLLSMEGSIRGAILLVNEYFESEKRIGNAIGKREVDQRKPFVESTSQAYRN
jgi:hypothetical protein